MDLVLVHAVDAAQVVHALPAADGEAVVPAAEAVAGGGAAVGDGGGWRSPRSSRRRGSLDLVQWDWNVGHRGWRATEEEDEEEEEEEDIAGRHHKSGAWTRTKRKPEDGEEVRSIKLVLKSQNSQTF